MSAADLDGIFLAAWGLLLFFVPEIYATGKAAVIRRFSWLYVVAALCAPVYCAVYGLSGDSYIFLSFAVAPLIYFRLYSLALSCFEARSGRAPVVFLAGRSPPVSDMYPGRVIWIDFVFNLLVRGGAVGLLIAIMWCIREVMGK